MLCKSIIEYKCRGIILPTLIYLVFFAKFFIQAFGRKKHLAFEEYTIVMKNNPIGLSPGLVITL